MIGIKAILALFSSRAHRTAESVARGNANSENLFSDVHL